MQMTSPVLNRAMENSILLLVSVGVVVVMSEAGDIKQCDLKQHNLTTTYGELAITSTQEKEMCKLKETSSNSTDFCLKTGSKQLEALQVNIVSLKSSTKPAKIVTNSTYFPNPESWYHILFTETKLGSFSPTYEYKFQVNQNDPLIYVKPTYPGDYFDFYLKGFTSYDPNCSILDKQEPSSREPQLPPHLVPLPTPAVRDQESKPDDQNGGLPWYILLLIGVAVVIVAIIAVMAVLAIRKQDSRRLIVMQEYPDQEAITGTPQAPQQDT